MCVCMDSSWERKEKNEKIYQRAFRYTYTPLKASSAVWLQVLKETSEAELAVTRALKTPEFQDWASGCLGTRSHEEQWL